MGIDAARLVQGAYLMLAARSLGLDCGPMSGFDADKVNAEFFPDGDWKVNFICNLGYGDLGKLFPRHPRLRFDEACRVLSARLPRPDLCPLSLERVRVRACLARTTMTPDLIALMSQYGLALVFFNVLMEQIGLPIPAIPTLVVAGALGAAGQLSLPLIFLVALVACLIADGTWYVIGRIYGNSVMRTLCRISLTPDSCVSETQSRFERWGVNALLVAKFVPGLSLIAPPLAGATRIAIPTFLLFNGIGAALWVIAGIGGGALFGKQVEYVLGKIQDYGTIAVIVIAASLAAYIGYKWWERQRFYNMLRMARISVDDLYRLIDSGSQPVVVDVRSHIARSLQPHRIPGALLVPLEAVEGHVKDLPRDRDIILYCTCPNESSAAHAAKQLMQHGFTRVRPLHGGLDAWIAAGYAVELLADATPEQSASTTQSMQL